MEGLSNEPDAWEQHVLDSIKDRLASSDPTLVARLTIFTRLASDEEMPAVKKSRPATPARYTPAGGPGAWACSRPCRRCCGW